jgi:hypothetical protein
MTAPLALATFLLAAAPATPPAMPRVDATILYRVAPAHRPVAVVRVYFAAAGRLLRIDAPEGGSATVLDRAHDTLTLVVDTQRTFLLVPMTRPLPDPFLLGTDMRFTATGVVRRIAGLSCAVWRTRGPDGGDGTACVTADGVLLAADGTDGAGGTGSVLALAATVAPLPPSLFVPPAGYRRLQAAPLAPAP